MSELSEVVSNRDEEMKEKLLDMSLDDLAQNMHLLEWDVKPFLRQSNYKPRGLGQYNPFLELTNEDDVRAADEDIFSKPKRKFSDTSMIPEIDLSGRSHRHFEYSSGKIFVYNILYEITDEDLQSLFSPFGPLRRAALNYDENGRSRGTAFVVYDDRDDAMRAFEALDGHFLDGRKLMLKFISSSGCRDPDKKHLYKRRGDEKIVDNTDCFKDKEVISADDLDFELDEYMSRRKRAKTWNYY